MVDASVFDKKIAFEVKFMNNKQKKLFSIGGIAKAVGITRKIILNYETKGLIKPDKKDGESGNRYYTIDTFTLFVLSVFFKIWGYPLTKSENILTTIPI